LTILQKCGCVLLAAALVVWFVWFVAVALALSMRADFGPESRRR